jgi:hypothetical protein
MLKSSSHEINSEKLFLNFHYNEMDVENESNRENNDVDSCDVNKSLLR